MVKKIAGRDRQHGRDSSKKSLHARRLKLKKLHREVAADRSELEGLSPEKLPPASSSNAARQARSRLNITFPVDWQELHTQKSSTDDADAAADVDNDTSGNQQD